MADEKEYYSVPEFAKELGVSRIAIFKRVKKGKIRAIRIGRNWAIPADELVSLLAIKNLTAENTMKGQSHAGLAMPSPPALAALFPVETAEQLCCQALINCSLKLHSVFVLHMALSVTSNFRIQAVMATFLGLPFDNNLS